MKKESKVYWLWLFGLRDGSALVSVVLAGLALVIAAVWLSGPLQLGVAVIATIYLLAMAIGGLPRLAHALGGKPDFSPVACPTCGKIEGIRLIYVIPLEGGNLAKQVGLGLARISQEPVTPESPLRVCRACGATWESGTEYLAARKSLA